MKKDICIKLGKKVKEERLAKGWSQEEFAERCGFHRTYIGMVERGERNPSLENLEKLAIGLDLSLSDLLSFD